MSNVIQIKRGYAKPAAGKLKDFELGIIRNELGGQAGTEENDYNFYSGCLYIGENNKIYPVKVESALSLDVTMPHRSFSWPENSEVIDEYPNYNNSNAKAKVSFIDIDNYTGGGAGYYGANPYDNNVPTSDAAWWHIMRVGAYTDGNYYTDIAIPFTQPSIYYKQVIRKTDASGVLQSPCGANDGAIKWVKVLDEDNYTQYAVKLTGNSTINGTLTASSLVSTSGIQCSSLRAFGSLTVKVGPNKPPESQIAKIHASNLDVAKYTWLGGVVEIGETYRWSTYGEESNEFRDYGDLTGQTYIYNIHHLQLHTDMYGNNFPSSPATGQLYFKLVEE